MTPASFYRRVYIELRRGEPVCSLEPALTQRSSREKTRSECRKMIIPSPLQLFAKTLATALQLFLKTLARDASGEKFLRDYEKLAYPFPCVREVHAEGRST